MRDKITKIFTLVILLQLKLNSSQATGFGSLSYEKSVDVHFSHFHLSGFLAHGTLWD